MKNIIRILDVYKQCWWCYIFYIHHKVERDKWWRCKMCVGRLDQSNENVWVMFNIFFFFYIVFGIMMKERTPLNLRYIFIKKVVIDWNKLIFVPRHTRKGHPDLISFLGSPKDISKLFNTPARHFCLTNICLYVVRGFHIIKPI